MTALENVAIGLHAQTCCGFFDAVLRTPRLRLEESGILERSMQALQFVGLGEIARVRASTLPYGHRRLLEIARAIVATPSFCCSTSPPRGSMRPNPRT